MSGITGTSGVGRAGDSDLDLPFDDILDALEFGAAVHFEAIHNNGWGAVVDYNYVGLGVTQGPLNVDIDQAVFEGFGLYRQTLGSGAVDYMAGIRRWNLKIETDLIVHREVNEDWIDFVVGARWIQNLNKNWKMYVSADVGAGGSDFTASAVAGIRYQINDLLDVDLQYKALWVDYEDGTSGASDYFKYNTTTQGPMIGLNFKF